MPTATEPLIAEFFRYNVWANRRLIEYCAGLSSQQLASREDGAYGTVYDTLQHIIRGEASYLNRLTGQRHPPPFNWDDRPALADVVAYAGQIGDALVEVAQKAQASAIVTEEHDGVIERYKAVALLIQAVNHGVEHRTNVTTILSQIGLKPPEVDGWAYLSANPDRLGADA